MLAKHKFGKKGSAELRSAGRFVANKVGERTRKSKDFRYFPAGKKGALEGLFLISAYIIIPIFFIIFFLGLIGSTSAKSAKQAEIVASEAAYSAFFSELIQKHGIEIAHGTTTEVEDVIENFAKKELPPIGNYNADCESTVGKDKQCKLSVTITIPLTVVAKWGIYTGEQLLLNAILSQVIKETRQKAYLPIKPAEAMEFILQTKVLIA